MKPTNSERASNQTLCMNCQYIKRQENKYERSKYI